MTIHDGPGPAASYDGNLMAGPLSEPASRGTVEVRDATLRVREVPQALTGINGTLSLDGAQRQRFLGGERPEHCEQHRLTQHHRA